MNIITLNNGQIQLPKQIQKKLHLKNKQKLVLETTETAIHIRPVNTNNYLNTNKKLKFILNHPKNLGTIKFRTRNDIYNNLN